MTAVGPGPVGTTTVPAVGVSFVEWGAVLAGAFLAIAISFVLLTFGAAIGLSAVSPWPNSGVSAKVIASLAVFWAMVQQRGARLLVFFRELPCRGYGQPKSRHENQPRFKWRCDSVARTSSKPRSGTLQSTR